MQNDNTLPKADTQPLRDLLLRVLIDLAMRQPEPDRSRFLDILKKDGCL